MNGDQLLSKFAIDKAVILGLASRAWQLVAGPITAILVTSRFSPELQGYYYTFASLLAWQAFVELGLHAIVVYFVSHDWARLSLDETGAITGAPDALARLVSFGRQLFRWYGGVAVAFVMIIAPAGVVFFWAGDTEVGWFWQWLLLVLLTSGSLWLIPFVAILEGCNQVEAINRFRFWLAVAGNLAVWTSLLLGAGLWTVIASASVRLLGELLLVGFTYRRFFTAFLEPIDGVGFSWKEEVWPMQWRAAVQSIAGYFGLAFVTPVVFHYHGSVLAGQMGLTWTLLVVIQGVGQAWIQPRVPMIGMLIAKRDFKTLNHVFRRVLLVSSCIIFLGVCSFAGFAWILTVWQYELANSWIPSNVSHTLERLRERVIDPASIMIFGVGMTCNHVATCLGIYVRAHRRDPLVLLSTSSSALMGLLIYLLGRYFAVTGAAVGYSGVFLLVAIPGHYCVLRKVVHQHHQKTEPTALHSETDDNGKG